MRIEDQNDHAAERERHHAEPGGVDLAGMVRIHAKIKLDMAFLWTFTALL